MSGRAPYLSLLALGVIALPCAAQPCPTVQSVSYTSAPSPSSLTSILGNPATVILFGPGSDDNVTTVGLPISFAYYGVSKTQVAISVNGLVGFTPGLIGASFTNDPPGTPGAEDDIVMPWWDDLHTGTIGNLAYQTTPGGSFVIEWNSVQHFPSNASGENATFQVVLNPSPANTIQFHYDQATFASGLDPWTASVGIEDASGGNALDLTALGANNSLFRPTDYTLTPMPSGPPMVIPSYNVSTTPFGMTSIAGQPGEVVVFNSATPEMPPCTFGCQGTAGAIFDDNWSAPVPLPFSFQYFSQPVTQIFIDVNGFVRFDSAPVCGDFTNAAMGSGAAAGRAGPFWDDLRGSTTSTGQISYLVSGAPGSQTLTVEWKDLETWSGASNCADTFTRLNFQLVLFQGSNNIEFKYGLLNLGNSPAPSGSIGVTNLAGTAGVDASMGGTASIFPTTNGYLLTPCTPCGFATGFGPTCPSSVGTSGGNPVSPNFGFTINQSGAAPGVPTILILGLSNSVWTIPPPLPLPFPLAGFGLAGGCSLLVSADIMIPTVTSPTGTSAFTVPVPPALAACAATLYAQWANVTAAAPLTVLTSNGLQIVTG